jgi:endonuclease G, mitochondrial
MTKRKENDQVKEQRLRKLLRRIAPDNDLGSLKESLESTPTNEDGNTAESLENLKFGGSSDATDNRFAIETLDVLINNPSDGILDSEQLYGLEAIVHKRFRPAVFVHRNSFRSMPNPWTHLGDGENRKAIEAAIPSVGRIEVPDHPSLPYCGTGFIVGENLVMTNRHVAEIFCRGIGRQHLKLLPGQQVQVDFLEEQGSFDELVMQVEQVVMIHPHWDMAILRVDKTPEGVLPLTLSSTRPEGLLNDDVVVIGYPAMDPRNDINLQNQIFGGVFDVKRLQPGKLLVHENFNCYYGRQVRAITHDCSTLGGNSGSVLLHLPSRQVVGLHFAGVYLKANYAVPAYDLASDKVVVDAGVNFGDGDAQPNNSYANVWNEADVDEAARPIGVTSFKQPSPSVTFQSPTPRTTIPTRRPFDWTQSLHITVSLGEPQFIKQELSKNAVFRSDETDLGEGRFGTQLVDDEALTGSFDLSALSSTERSWKSSYSAALTSQLAYEPADVVLRICRQRWSFDRCEFVESGSTQSFFASTEAFHLIAFRGTEELADWLTDLRILGTQRPYGTIHRGFLHGFRQIESQLLDLVGSGPVRPLILTGHSLGGALAVIAAAEWHGLLPIESIFTFGQPAVGKNRFVGFMTEAYGNRHIRVVNDDDIVPKVPPTYVHTGKLIHLGRGRFTESIALGNRVESSREAIDEPQTMSEDDFAMLQEQLQAMRTTQITSNESPQMHAEGFFPSFRDHRLSGYIKQLQKQFKLGTEI